MQKKNKTKIRYSIFFKLIILFVIFIVIVNLSIGFLVSRFFGKGPPGSPEHFPNLVNKYVISSIGNPPDTNAARKFSSEFEMNIRIETSTVHWTSDESIPDIANVIRDNEFKKTENVFMIWKKSRPYFINKIDGGYIILAPWLPRDMINETNIVIYAILIITLLAALLYFSLSWIFGPVKKLSDGVKLISEGNFNNNIEVNRKDELGNLADSINEMKDNISNMMKSKETLLIDVSHELRSPLTRIKLANEFIEDKNINAKIRDDVKEMELMISELLDTYRMEKGNDKLYKLNFDLINLINKAIAKFDLNSIHVNSQFKEKIISGDERKMETAFHNIIDNAVKYSDGKPVDIEVFENSQRKDLVYVSVKDKGNGIAEEELKKIFEPFYRIDKSRDKKIQGYGLGLSLVKKILDGHNAEIKVNSKPAEGTEFLISIPVSIQNH